MAIGVTSFITAIRCLSTDTKPSPPPAYRQILYEVDTGLWYAWNGSAWVAYSGA